MRRQNKIDYHLLEQHDYLNSYRPVYNQSIEESHLYNTIILNSVLKQVSHIQMVLALRYLHCDKGIVHRDLTPNNIMLGDYDKVTLSE